MGLSSYRSAPGLPNLAGVEPAFADAAVASELTLAGIELVHGEVDRRSEVATRIQGRLGTFRLSRFWRYWVVDHGRVPLSVALELHADPAARLDVRAGGHCGSVHPSEQAEWYRPNGRRILHSSEEETCRRILRDCPGDRIAAAMKDLLATCDFVDHPSKEPDAEGFVPTYHIDTQIGLRVFADALRRHGLDLDSDTPLKVGPRVS